MSARKSINLLPKEEFDASVTGRALKWATGTFRIIVIITELIVMTAFLSRFWLDAQNSDLNDAISVKSAQIESQSDFEKSFRDLQDRLSVFNDYTKNTGTSDFLTKITSHVPQNIVLQSLTLQDGAIQVKGNAGSEIDVSQFISNLKTEKTFKNITLEQVGTSDTNELSILFNIKISI